MNTIIDQQKATHYTWGENCDSWVLADTTGLSIKHEKMPKDTKEKLHFHSKAKQFFFVLKGNATFYQNNEKEIIGPQQGLLVLPKTQHYIANETKEPIEFLVISQPGTDNDRINV